jgi:hypothetical protein
MDKIHKPSDSDSYRPSSEPFTFYRNFHVDNPGTNRLGCDITNVFQPELILVRLKCLLKGIS